MMKARKPITRNPAGVAKRAGDSVPMRPIRSVDGDRSLALGNRLAQRQFTKTTPAPGTEWKLTEAYRFVRESMPAGTSLRPTPRIRTLPAGTRVAVLEEQRSLRPPLPWLDIRVRLDSGEIGSLKVAVDTIHWLARSTLTRPVQGRISQRFEWRRHPVTKRWGWHQGIDIAARKGTAIRAAASGRVVVLRTTAEGRGYGKYVVIAHGGEVKTLYAHLDAFQVRRGSRVSEGQVIGTVGKTGAATGPHLHFEVRFRGSKIDPLSVVR